MRDSLLSLASAELDFATSAPPSQTAELLEAFAGHAAYRVGEKFGTIGTNVEGYTIEVTTFRSREVYASGSRKPMVEFGRTIDEDLSRRDFSINAIAFNPITEQLIDPFHGAEDLRDRILRAVGSPNERFEEDPLRLLRAVRFAARLQLKIESDTAIAMKRSAPALNSISRERIRDEYSRLLANDYAEAALTLLRDLSLLKHSVPELDELTRMPDHGPNHPLSLWDHTMRVVGAVPTELTLRWAALLHDIAKPATRSQEPDGRTRFFHHETRGAEMARRILTGLRYPTSDIDTVTLLVETHMQLHAFSRDWSDGAVRRLCLRLGTRMESALALARADAAGHAQDGSSVNSPKFDALEDRLKQLGSDHVQTMRSPLSGDDLMRHYSRPAGPWIRVVKDRLLDEVLEGTLSQDDPDAAWAVADRAMREGSL
jgi:poly(A) polymerase